MYSVTFLCDELLNFVKEQGFKEGTLIRYRRSLKVFINFCDERGVENYTPEIGLEFANDLIPKNSSKVSADRKSFRRKAVRHFNHYLEYGYFVLEYPERKRFDSEALDGNFNKDYMLFKEHILKKYNNQNTIKFYLYEVYIFLGFLVSVGINDLNQLTNLALFRYLENVKVNRQRAAVCALKYYFNYMSDHLTHYAVKDAIA